MKDRFSITLTGKNTEYRPVDLDTLLDYLASGDFINVGHIRMKPLRGGDNSGFSVNKAVQSQSLRTELEQRRKLLSSVAYEPVRKETDRKAANCELDAPIVDEHEDKSSINDILDISNRQIPNTTKEQLIQARLGQGKFRQNVIATWGIGECCAVTGIDIKPLLIASHIIPWRESDDQQRLSGRNGILLCSHLDKLFDQHLISFDDQGQLIISDRLSEADWVSLQEIGVNRSMLLNTKYLSDEDTLEIGASLNVHRQRLAEQDRAGSSES